MTPARADHEAAWKAATRKPAPGTHDGPPHTAAYLACPGCAFIDRIIAEATAAAEQRLRERIEAELVLRSDEADPFEQGCGAAYNFVLSLLGAPPSASPRQGEPVDGVHDAAIGLLIAVDNALMDAFLNSEDGAEEPAWIDALHDAVDKARDVITPPAAALSEPAEAP